MGYWLVTEPKFVTNQTSYITGLPASCRPGVVEEFERSDLQLCKSDCSGDTRDFRNRHG